MKAALANAPLPTYFTDERGAPPGLLTSERTGDGPWPIDGVKLVSCLGTGGVVMVGTLTVAFLSPGPAEAAGLRRLEVLSFPFFSKLKNRRICHFLHHNHSC